MLGKIDCNHCIYIRPKKGNMCTISRLHVVDINTYSCKDFKVDIIVDRIEKMQEGDKKDDDGSKRPYWLFELNSNFGLSFA